MSAITNSRKQSSIIIAVIVALAAIVLLLAPEEQTLGSGIKSVYLHVALIWTGMTGLVAAGLLGLAVAVTGRRRLEEWSRSITWVALVMFAAGLAMSVVAAGINWGAVFWAEPRTNAALQLLALGLIVQIANGWPIPCRLKGALRALLVGFMIWTTATTPLVLHPGEAARSSTSWAIRLTFLSLFILCSLAAIWIVVQLQSRKLGGDQGEGSLG